MIDNGSKAKIATAQRGVEAAEKLALRELLIDASNAELLDVEDRLQRVLTRVRAEMENRGLF